MAPPSTFERPDVARVTRSPWLIGLPFTGLFPLVAYFVASSRGVGDTFTLGLGLLSIVMPIAALMIGLRKFSPRVERGALKADTHGVYWNGALVWPRASIRSGLVVPNTPHGTVVRLSNPSRFRSIDLVVADEAEGRALLDALDLGTSRRTAQFLAHPRMHGAPAVAGLMVAAIAGAFFGLTALMRGGHGLFGIIVAVVFAMLPYIPVVASVAPTKVTVGVDGVLLRRLGMDQFIPFRDVASVEMYDEGVHLVLRDGRKVPLRVGPLDSKVLAIHTEQSAEREALYTRLRDAMGEHARGEQPGVSALAVDRGGRTVTAWIAHLRELAQRQEGGMRQAPVLRSTLWSLLGDPNASSTDRAGAAVALAESGRDEPSTQERLRVVAGAVASPRLRVVIEAAAEGTDARLTRAIELLDEDDVSSLAPAEQALEMRPRGDDEP